MLNKKISTIALTLLITGAIDSIRNLPAAALFGTTLPFFFIFSAIVFLIPVALISAELSASYTDRSGIYAWTEMAMGKKMGFVAIWLQWINTMVWYPTILSFIAGTAAFMINPHLIENKAYLITVILVVFWSLTLINLRGLYVSTRFTNFCALVGMVIPMLIIILLALIWCFSHHAIQLHFSAHNIFPSFKNASHWIALTAIMTSFLGIELATVHVKQVKQPQKTFPRALFVSVLFILFTMVLGSLSIATVIPYQEINLVGGIMQAYTLFFSAYHIAWAMPVMTVMILVGSLGSMVNWIISPAKGLLQAGQQGYLPLFLRRENKFGVARNLLIMQALLVTLLCLVFLLMPSVNGFYWLLTDLSTQLYMIMYVIMFTSAWRLKNKNPHASGGFKIPGKAVGTKIICLLGFIGCFITLIVGFFPPDGIDVGGALHYELVFVIGILAMLMPGLFPFIQAKFMRR